LAIQRYKSDSHCQNAIYAANSSSEIPFFHRSLNGCLRDLKISLEKKKSVRVSSKAWEVIRRLAFKSNLPMSSIVDELLAHR
jgi:hypothetical protein